MSSVVLVIILVMALMLCVTGVLAMATGRVVLPWVRKGVKQPRVWGAGALLIAASLTAAWLVPFRGQSLLMLAGLALNWRAQGWRHRRPPGRSETPVLGLFGVSYGMAGLLRRPWRDGEVRILWGIMTKPTTGESASEAMARHKAVMAQREKALDLMARQAAARKAESDQAPSEKPATGKRRASCGWGAVCGPSLAAYRLSGSTADPPHANPPTRSGGYAAVVSTGLG